MRSVSSLQNEAKQGSHLQCISSGNVLSDSREVESGDSKVSQRKSCLINANCQHVLSLFLLLIYTHTTTMDIKNMFDVKGKVSVFIQDNRVSLPSNETRH